MHSFLHLNNKSVRFIRFGFATKTIGEHCSPLHLRNYFAIFIKPNKNGWITFFVNPTVNFLFGNLNPNLFSAGTNTCGGKYIHKTEENIGCYVEHINHKNNLSVDNIKYDVNHSDNHKHYCKFA